MVFIIWDTLRDLVPFVQYKNVKDTISKVESCNLTKSNTPQWGFFFMFLSFTTGTNLRKACSHETFDCFSCLGCFLSPVIVLVIWCYDGSFLINAQYLYCRNYGMKQSIFCLCLKWTRWVEWFYWIMTLFILNGRQFIYLQSWS